MPSPAECLPWPGSQANIRYQLSHKIIIKKLEAQVIDIMGEETSDLTLPAVDSCDYKTVIATGFITFSTVNFLTRFVIPDSACQNPQQSWKWRNVATSFLHSLITGIWAPICFYQVTSR